MLGGSLCLISYDEIETQGFEEGRYEPLRDFVLE